VSIAYLDLLPSLGGTEVDVDDFIMTRRRVKPRADVAFDDDPDEKCDEDAEDDPDDDTTSGGDDDMLVPLVLLVATGLGGITDDGGGVEGDNVVDRDDDDTSLPSNANDDNDDSAVAFDGITVVLSDGMVVNGATASSAIRMRVNTSAQSSIRAK
jgi:hypothetical protein